MAVYLEQPGTNDKFLYKEITTDGAGNITGTRTVETQALTTIFTHCSKMIEEQDKVLAGLYEDMAKQTGQLTDINDALQALNSAKSAMGNNTSTTLDSDVQAKIKALVDAGVLDIGTIDVSKALDRATIETLQSNLSTAQSSQGALNEDMSLRLNQAASARTAVFTQLQTLLQTIMQLMQQLSRM